LVVTFDCSVRSFLMYSDSSFAEGFGEADSIVTVGSPGLMNALEKRRS
jgi:hypothetical protein